MISKTFRLAPLLFLLFLFVFPLQSIAEERAQYEEPHSQKSMSTSSYVDVGVEGTSIGGEQLYYDSNGGLQKKVPGVGSSLGAILDKLISLTGGSESQMRQIVGNLPLLFPDLYKVFITL